MNAFNLGSRQIKAARALLDWSQEDLATASKLSIATIRKLELGSISPRAATTATLRESLEGAGVEFTESEGVRRRQEGIRIYQGAEKAALFFGDIVTTLHRNGGALLAVVPSMAELESLLGLCAVRNLEGLVRNNSAAAVKIILTDSHDLPPSSSRLDYRSISTKYVDPMSFCVFGDKYALAAPGDYGESKIVVVQSSAVARSSSRHFYSMWEKAVCPAALMQDNGTRTALRRMS